MQQLMYFCISVFTGFLWIQLDFLIKNNRTSMSSCVFSQNMGDTVKVLWLQDARGVRLTPLDGVDGGDHCKNHCCLVLSCVPAFPQTEA